MIRSLTTFLLAAAFTSLASRTDAAPILASGSFGANEYLVVGDAVANWAQANDAAQALGPGWHLVTVNSADEQAFLVGLLDGANLGSGQLWAGGLQSPNSDTGDANWTWVTGEPWGPTAWASDHAQEPNDAFGPGSEGYLTLDNRWQRHWTWNDETLESRERLGFVAERTVVPEPASLIVFGLAACGAGLALRRRRPAR